MKKHYIIFLLALTVQIGSVIAQTCDGITRLTTNTGTIEDGSGADINYSNNLSCRWVVKPAGGGPIRISFESFDTESGYDYLRIYEDTIDSENLIAELAGSELPDNILSSADSVYLHFTSDGSFASEGWELSYESGFTNNAPIADDQTFSIKEQSFPGTSVDTIVATDSDGDQIRFEILSGNDDGFFSLEEESGIITLADESAELDFETQSSYSLSVEATDGISNVDITVTINVQDIDEAQAPQIEDQEFIISENSPFGTEIGQVEATDPNGEILTFTLIDGFVSLTSSGILSTSSTNLDFETNPQITYIVGVTNGELSSRAEITLNLTDVGCSDNTLTEASGTFDDGSGDALYENNSDCSWLIQPEAGGPIRLTFNSLDLEDGYDHLTIYEGTDNTGTMVAQLTGSTVPGSIPSSADALFIEFTSDGIINRQGWEISYETDFTNEEPTLENQTFGVLDTFDEATTFATVDVSNTDEDYLQFTIVSGNTNDDFLLDAETGELQINADNGNTLDAATLSEYNLVVEVTDNIATASATITINVLGTADAGTPTIEDQTLEISENSVYGTSIGFLTAADPDNLELTYEIYSGNSGSEFQLSETGELLVNTSSLDFESTSSYSFEVTANNSVNTSAPATITINITDVGCAGETLTANSGSFSDGSGAAYYDNNSDCEWLIQPEGGGPIEFTINSFDTEQGYDYVRIYAGTDNSGDLVAELSGSPDTEDPILIEANSAFVTFTSDGSFIDPGWEISYNTVNLAPEVEDQNFSIDENSEFGAEVGTVVANDLDDLTFSITDGNQSGAFAIGGATGVITVASQEELNFEVTTTYTLTVEVSDGETTVSAEITISVQDANDAPVIEDFTFSVDENSPQNTVVGTVSATDEDGDELSYSITEGNDNTVFIIESSSGNILVEDPSFLDFETTTSFSLTVGASDGEATSTAQVTINLNDVDDPVLSAASPEETVKYFPNPVKNKLTIHLKAGSGEYIHVKITDLSGKTLNNLFEGRSRSGSFDQSFNISELPSGLYLLMINSSEGRMTYKISKE